MRTCPACKLEIPDGARRCGHCGKDLYGPAEQVLRLVIGLALGLILAFVVVGLLLSR